MYCSVCGTQSAQGLKFCKSCGARMAGDNSDVRNSVAKTFSLSAVFLAAFGMIAFAVIVKELLASGAQSSFILLISTLYLGSLGAIIYMIVRQVFKLIGVATDERPVDDNSVPVFRPAEAARLVEHREPASVVENTTRDLSGVRVERE